MLTDHSRRHRRRDVPCESSEALLKLPASSRVLDFFLHLGCRWRREPLIVRPRFRSNAFLSIRWAGALFGDAFAYGQQKLGEQPPLLGVEGGEEMVLGLALGARRTVELALAGGGQGHHVAAAIARVAPPLDEAAFLQRVEQLDQGTGVDLHLLVQVGLAHGAAVVQQAEQLEAARRELDRGVSGAQPAHRLLPHEGQQETGARSPFFEDLVARLASVVWHHAGQLTRHNRLCHSIVLTQRRVGVESKEATMRAVAITDAGAEPAVVDVPTPSAAPGEVLVKVQASSVNGFDVAVAAGMLQGMMEHRYPVVLGKDFAGVVEANGEGASLFAPGDLVFGVTMKPYLGDGGWGEFLVVGEQHGIAAVPEGLDFAKAGALGLAGTAGLQAVEAIGGTSGRTVLVSGASGGVGAIALQYALAAGADVIATARPGAEADLVRKLGAQHVVDYAGDLEAQVRAIAPDGVDAVLHFAGDPSQLTALVAADGRLVSTVGFGPDQHPAATALMADPDSATLGRLGADVAAGRVKLPITRTYSLGEANQALADFPAGTVGKFAVTVWEA